MHIKNLHILLLTIATISLASCSKSYTPRPRGYMRLTPPDTCYHDLGKRSFPYTFDISCNAQLKEHQQKDETYWIDIVYPSLNTQIHCSYKPVNNNLRELSDDSQNFVFKHAQQASAIPEQEYTDGDNHIYCIMYELKGNTASPIQFYMTDSTHHFFRGAVYFDFIPNQDSVAPIISYLQTDVQRLIESFRWK